MKGETLLINGDRWTVVDVAPAPELAEMVAVLLEEEGFTVLTRGADTLVSDVLTHLGAHSQGRALVLVPEADAERALGVIAETVTDYEGEDIDALLEELALEGDPDTLGDGLEHPPEDDR
jgi:hypothetical protein